VKSGHHKRLASMAASQARKSCTRTSKSAKDTQTRAKRLMREMLVFWKKNEREERDVRKRAEKEAVDRAREEEEKREAARQARKLEFLISQTELYSHFVGNKLKSKLVFLSLAPAGSEKRVAVEVEQLTDEATARDAQDGPSELPLGAEDASTAPLDELDFDDGVCSLLSAFFILKRCCQRIKQISIGMLHATLRTPSYSHGSVHRRLTHKLRMTARRMRPALVHNRLSMKRVTVLLRLQAQRLRPPLSLIVSCCGRDVVLRLMYWQWTRMS
jgi:DNA-binding domain